MNIEEEKLSEIEAQLFCPKGEKGIEMGEAMHATNIGMTLAAINALEIYDECNILEIGHGNGKHVGNLMHEANGLRYFGIDISESMHNEAIKNALPFKDQVSFCLYNGVNMPFEANFFNKIFTVNTVYFWKNPQEFLEEVYRVLKPGGHFSISFADKTFMQQLPFVKELFALYSADDMEVLALGSPFKLLKIDQKEEKVTSKAGEEITRIYHVALLGK
ncbi:class I SAM-dependent methyltransferase [Galbibacter pacificus]|uniref:Class I SAM-dependent methyltransferase n=1 Tax=Galbibacter pacificus TaxID=2996052 RepID=A0ABT6FVH7_9FLAO|nr:class I SAM-dependent methyltransferase [Galbibacter pacificus]MDG3583821.1 class I SAM-dependent methyltransferase [Galbibacter pacificus]MDG3587261.1 class I SAM-dependent methyltransferase [Galbibacter pacificus]